jgi:histidinol dehydrogenase
LRVIKGFKAAKAELSRKAITGLSAASPALRERLEKMFGTPEPEAVVARILSDVKERGDAAVRDYTLKIDGIKLDSLKISRDEINAAVRTVSPDFLAAIKLAAERVRAFHQSEKDAVWQGIAGMNGGMVIRPLERVGVYVPGGTAPLPSTVLMTAIPARVAGVKEIVLTSPPQKNGRISPHVLVAAELAGVDYVFTAGGAQAVAAMAYGTESVPRVDKICGPGNLFVMLAKKQVFGAVAIDALQGPSEVMIIADAQANPAICAADLLAQAEHDMLSQATFVTTSERLAADVFAEVEKQMATLPRKAIAGESIKERGVIAVVETIEEAIELANIYAPEHLCLFFDSAEKWVDKINNAGCIFIGENSGEVLGDYDAGPSHALPTGGTARFSSPLNITDFIKYINVVSIVDKTLCRKLWSAAATIARVEGLEGHARAADKRLE